VVYRCCSVFTHSDATHGKARVADEHVTASSHGTHAEGSSGVVGLFQIGDEVQSIAIMVEKDPKMIVPLDHFPSTLTRSLQVVFLEK
jgi:hypothetical protein